MQLYRLSLAVIFSAILAGDCLGDDNSSVHSGRPRKVLVGDYSAKALAIVNEKGDIEWQTPIRNIHDAAKLANGNILFQTDWTEIVEMTPDYKIVWKYDAAKQNGNEGKRVEVHAFQRLANGSTMIVESGPARIIEVDAMGKLLKEVPLQVEHRNPHTDTRLVRKLDNGNYLVAHEGDNQVVREYDEKGKVVWEYKTGTKVYSALRLENGNTLIGMGDGRRVIEVDKQGKTVWSVEEKELPGITLAWVTMVERLANGNTLIVNCHAGEANPQLVEVDPQKKVVWTFKDFRRFGNSLPVARIIE
ncbi:beta-propeller domain-containing protein [Schlesneria sp.]|uniref:beta-propeller domain-containing protein n=1 Tax=Schlesneria sp. TaxID=2762018 RepID=UPI002EE5D114